LLGLSSFWEGIDVVGEALTCLVIVKLPFSVPSDPVFAARSDLYEDPFSEYALPQAVIRLKQGFGRLIRSGSDRGVVAILDSRLFTKRYGEVFLRSLPPAARVRCPAAELSDHVLRFLRTK
jgi:DNA polymerase-3 subunit epsilon/ATP-dependent DNA helicase DinG